jgi:cold shock CspA family protein
MQSKGRFIATLVVAMLFSLGAGAEKRISGTVKWFTSTKGYGFITCKQKGEAVDAYVKYDQIRFKSAAGPVVKFRTLAAGERVTLRFAKTREGYPIAKDVQPPGRRLMSLLSARGR